MRITCWIIKLQTHTQKKKYLWLLHHNNSYANPPQCYVDTFIAYLVKYFVLLIRIYLFLETLIYSYMTGETLCLVVRYFPFSMPLALPWKVAVHLTSYMLFISRSYQLQPIGPNCFTHTHTRTHTQTQYTSYLDSSTDSKVCNFISER